jgi:hypothetical protein
MINNREKILGILLFVGVSFLLMAGWACKDDPKEAGEKAVPKQTQEGIMPDSVMALLQNRCDRVDVISYISELSMGFSDKNVRAVIGMITNEPAQAGNCSAEARLDFLGNGELIMTGDLYLSGGCSYVRIEYGGKHYSHIVASQGADFFRTALKPKSKEGSE